MSISVSERIFLHADSFYKLASHAGRGGCIVEGTSIAYVSILGFALELYLKSLATETSTRLELLVGNSEMHSVFSRSTVRGHDLVSVYRRLPLKTRKHLRAICDPICRQTIGMSFIRNLHEFRLVFPEGRYAFESDNRAARFQLGLGGANDIMKLTEIIRDALVPYLDGDHSGTRFSKSDNS